MNKCSENPVFQAKARDIAALLGDGWTAGEGHPNFWSVNAVLKHPSGMEILFHINDATPDRIAVSGDYPKTAKGEYIKPDHNPQIGLSAKKTAEQIAAEIKRRFLPDYTAAWEAVKATVDGWDEHAAESRKARAALSAFPMVQFSAKDPDDMQGWLRLTGQVYGKVRVNSAKSIELQIRGLTVAQATAILALLD